MTVATGTTRESNRSTSYTAKLSYDPFRLGSRTTIKLCLLNVAPSSYFLDKTLGYVSVGTSCFLTAYLIGGLICLIPSICLSKLMGWPSYFKTNNKKIKNVSTSNSGSMTALKTLSARSQMFLQDSGGPDYLAPILMKELSLFGPNIPGSRLYSQVYLFLARWNFYLTGRIFSDQLAQSMRIEFKLGEAAFLQARTCWLDDCVETFVREKTSDTTTATKENEAKINVVVLGAGYDTRCYRLNLKERGVFTYEVDTPGTQALKIEVLRRTNIDINGTKFVSCDFETEDWLECLKKKAGFQSNLPTFFIWEGVTPYLSRDIVKSTLEKVACCGLGSCIGCDYLDRSWALSPQLAKASKRGGEPFQFGMKDTEPEELVAECNKSNNDRNNKKDANVTEAPKTGGEKDATEATNNSGNINYELFILDHLKHHEVIHRYIAKHCDGRPIGYLEDFGGFLLVGSN